MSDAGRAERELRDALATRSPEAIAQAALSNIWPLYSHHYRLLTSTVESLPSAVLERYPVLRVVHPMTPVLARTTRPFKPLVSPDAARTMSPDELDVLTLVQMVAFRFSGDVAAALIYARRLDGRIGQMGIESRERVDGPLWYYHHQIGSTLLAAGDTSRALLALATARQLGALSGQPDAERIVLGRSALAHAVRGSLDEAEHALRAGRALSTPTDAHRLSNATTERAAAALIAVERLSPDMDELVAVLEPYDSIQLSWPFAVLARVRALLARQRPDEAAEAVRLAQEAHPEQHGSFASDAISAATVDALWAVGDAAGARRAADGGMRTGRMTTVAGIRLALLESRVDHALAGLQSLATDMTSGPAQRAESLLLSTWCEFARTRSVDPAVARQIARLVDRGGIRRMLSTVPAQLVEAISSTLADSDRPTFLLATRELPFPDMPSRPSLTTSEVRVLNALPLHPTTSAIAAALHVSPNTIKTQLKSLYRKLGCSTREEAIRAGSRLRLIGERG